MKSSLVQLCCVRIGNNLYPSSRFPDPLPSIYQTHGAHL